MPWDIDLTGSGGSGSGGTGGNMVMHGDEWHTKLYQTKVNANLLYNSTGILNLNGWVSENHQVINFRDDFIMDDYAYFLCTGNDAGVGFISLSAPVVPGAYTFSGYFESTDPIKVSVLFQSQSQLNSELGTSLELFNKAFATMIREHLTINVPAGTVGLAIKIEHLATNSSHTAKYKRMKLEEGSILTDWIPCMSDPYVANVNLTGLTASDFA